MSRADKILARLHSKGRPAAGFLYAKAVRHVLADCNPWLTWKAFAEAIDCTPGQLRKIQNGTVPNHITGSLLWGLLWEVYGDKKRRELFLTDAQRSGGKLLK